MDSFISSIIFVNRDRCLSKNGQILKKKKKKPNVDSKTHKSILHNMFKGSSFSPGTLESFKATPALSIAISEAIIPFLWHMHMLQKRLATSTGEVILLNMKC